MEKFEDHSIKILTEITLSSIADIVSHYENIHPRKIVCVFIHPEIFVNIIASNLKIIDSIGGKSKLKINHYHILHSESVDDNEILIF